MVRLGEVSPGVWDVVETFRGFTMDDVALNWRKAANMNKFDRELFERYGYFKDIILHSRFQQIKQYLFENVEFDFSLFLGDPLMPTATSIIILFMLNKRVSYVVLVMAGLFMFNVNALYVAVLIFVFWIFSKKVALPKGFREIKVSEGDWKSYVGDVLCGAGSAVDSSFDHVLIGGDIATLYTAALLSRNGHRCCVLQPVDGHPVQV